MSTNFKLASQIEIYCGKPLKISRSGTTAGVGDPRLGFSAAGMCSRGAKWQTRADEPLAAGSARRKSGVTPGCAAAFEVRPGLHRERDFPMMLSAAWTPLGVFTRLCRPPLRSLLLQRVWRRRMSVSCQPSPQIGLALTDTSLPESQEVAAAWVVACPPHSPKPKPDRVAVGGGSCVSLLPS